MKYSSYCIIFCFILINLLILAIPAGFSYPYYNEDCRNHHGVTYISIPYDKYANITLDGKPTESFWTNPNNAKGFIRVPTASLASTPGKVNITMNLTFIMNDYQLLILCEWIDNTTKPSGDAVYDGLYFCWNINVPEFSAYFTGGMWTSPMGGGDIDSWKWSFDSLINYHENGSTYFCEDNCIRTYGWYEPSHGTDNDDVVVGFIYKTNYTYTLEIKRNLYTNEIYDVQFNENKLYEFNIAVINDASLGSHAISWVYAIDLRDNILASEKEKEENHTKTKFNFGLLIIIIVLFSCLIITFIFYYATKKVKKNNLK